MKKLLIALLFTFNASAMDMASYQMGITQGKIQAKQEQEHIQAEQETQVQPNTFYDCPTAFLPVSNTKIITEFGEVPAVHYFCSIGARPEYSFDTNYVYVAVAVSPDQTVVLGYRHTSDSLRLISWNWIYLNKKSDRLAAERFLRTLK